MRNKEANVKRAKKAPYSFREGAMYGNCLLLSPSGLKLARVSEDKAKWYLENNLAKLEEENPYKVLRLLFNPKKPMEDVEDPYLTGIKENKCVVCASVEELTFHHIVPYCYRRYFPKELKNYSSYDITILCAEHHFTYEKEASKFKHKISRDLGVEENSASFDKESINSHFVGNYCNTLLRNWDKIPANRREEMMLKIKNTLNLPSIDTSDLERLKKHSCRNLWKDVDTRKHYREVVEKLDNIEQFCFMWRRHFVDVLNPQHMHPLWNINRSIYRKPYIESEPYV
jgi:hypothetical protein